MDRAQSNLVRFRIESTLWQLLDDLNHDVWRAHRAGEIGDGQAQQMAEMLADCGQPLREGMAKPIRFRPLRPTLNAIEIEPHDGAPGTVVAWCPWSEALLRQYPGSEPRLVPSPGFADPASPVSSGYSLKVTAKARTEHAAVPAAPMVFQGRLRDALAGSAAELQRHVLHALLGRCRLNRGVLSKTLRKGSLWIFRLHRRWLITQPDKPDIEGHGGVLQLAADLYGMPAGVAAVRILEATTGEEFDAVAALSLQRVVDEWMGRGAPARGVC